MLTAFMMLLCIYFVSTYVILVSTWGILCRCLTHWGRVTHICVSKLTIIGSDNGLSPGRHQAIIWTNAGILLIRTLGTNFSEILLICEILAFSFKKMHLKLSSAKWRPFCHSFNVLSHRLSLVYYNMIYHEHFNWRQSITFGIENICIYIINSSWNI